MILGILLAVAVCAAIGLAVAFECVKLIVEPGYPPGWDQSSGNVRFLVGWRILMRCLGLLGLAGIAAAIACIVLLP